MGISAVKKFVKRIDRAVGRLTGPRKVLVEARTPVYLAVLGPLLRALVDDPRVICRITGGDSPATFEEACRTGLGPAWVEREDVIWERFDLLVNADPWGTLPLRRCAHRVNFFHGVAGKYDLDCPAGLPAGFDTYSRVAFANSDRMQRYLAAGIVRADQAALVGYPKLDALVNDTYDGAAVRRDLGLPDDRPTILYGPTWSVASSLHLAGEAIVDALLTAGFNVIAKLHDRSLQTSEKFTGGVDWRERLARFVRTPGFALAPGSDASPYLAAADAMITDHSSIGFEYLVLDRPLLVYDAPDLPRVARINPEKVALLRSAATVVDTPQALVSALGAALAQPDALAAERRRIAGLMFHEPGTATARALTLLYALLDLSVPSGARVAQRPAGAGVAPAPREAA